MNDTIKDTITTDISAAINAAHFAACHAVQTGLEHARRAGDLLIQAKATLPHGAWLPWLAEHCPTVSPRMAQGYMRIAREWPQLEANTQRVADLSIREALSKLTVDCTRLD